MIKIDGKTAVSISAMGENHAYQYALVVRPDTMEELGQDCYYYDECGHAVFFDEREYGCRYAEQNNLILLPYMFLEELYGCVEGDTGWVVAEDTPFSDAVNGAEKRIA